MTSKAAPGEERGLFVSGEGISGDRQSFRVDRSGAMRPFFSALTRTARIESRLCYLPEAVGLNERPALGQRYRENTAGDLSLHGSVINARAQPEPQAVVAL